MENKIYMEDKTTKTLQATFKSQDTEEWLDIHFTRPLGWGIAFACEKLGIHPNLVTVVSILLGALAGYFFHFTDLTLNCVGIGLLVFANLLDSADGQLARMTGQKTRLGRVLDGFAGDVWFVCIYAAICWRLQSEFIPFTDLKWGIGIWMVCAVVGFGFHGNQCKLADYYRNIHLFFLKGVKGSELENSEALRKEFKSLSWREDFIWKLFLFFYARYTKAQEDMTPGFQKLHKKLQENFPNGVLPAALCEDFCRQSRPLMAYANILTFNTRAIVLYVSLLVGQPLWYLLFETIILNALFIFMRSRHEKICRNFVVTSSSSSDSQPLS